MVNGKRIILFCAAMGLTVAAAAKSDDLLIADFEGKTYSGWTVEGDAFGLAPARANVNPPNRVVGYQGKGLVNSYFGEDRSVGMLTSPEITLERQHINFLIGGGSDEGKTCMNLLVDGQLVRTAAGSQTKDQGREVLDWKSWDVEPFMGKKAVLQIVDDSRGAWGHIDIDHIVQSDTPRTPAFKPTDGKLPLKSRVSKVPKYTFSETLDEQEKQLADNPLLERFRASRAKILQDPHHPLYHFTSPENRLNDPNGLSFWNGKWHLFYQAYPPEDPRQHWGHAVSEDLIHWRDLPYAIYPDPEYACFSGSALVEEDRVIAMYHGMMAGSMVAVSDDPLLLNWEKVTGRAVITPAIVGDPPLPNRVFDPCIWKKDGVYYALTSGTLPWGPGGKRMRAEFLHRSKDLVTWEYMHPFLEDDHYGLVGDDGACPYFWPLGDRHILIHYSHTSGGKYLLGDYDLDRDKFVVTDGGDFNFGPSCPSGVHAPSAAPDGNGGVLVIFNMNPGKPRDGWDQLMSLPRRLTLAEGDPIDPIRQEPAGDFQSLRTGHQHVDAMELPANEEVVLDAIKGNAMELVAEIDPQSAQMVELDVLCSANKEEVTRILFLADRGYTHREFGVEDPWARKFSSLISIDTTRSSILPDARSRAAETAPFYMGKGEILKLHVFIDKSVVEVFVNGRQCAAVRVYPGREDSVGVCLRAQGSGAVLQSLDAWQMKSIYE